jgi:glycosyltransferase involved in cell wall biosynthesis
MRTQADLMASSDNQRLKVLLLFSSSEVGGAERSLSRMAFASSAVDYQLATLSDEGPWCDWIRKQGCEPLVLGRRVTGRRLMFAAYWRLILYVRRQPVDVIYVCGARAAFLLRVLRILMPSIKLVHGVRWNPDSNNRLDRFFRRIEQYTHFLVDAWITNSAAAKQTLVSRCGISEERVFVIYNGLESLPSDLTQQEEKQMEVLTVANLNPRKGHREYLHVVREVLKAVPEAKFVFVGRDDMNGAVQEAILEAELSQFVRYEGFQEDVSTWYKRARLMVLPSLWGEGCPTSILEGSVYGLPVVAYAIDGIPELINNGVNGFVVSPKNPVKLARAIISILRDPDRATILGAVGRDNVLNHFTLAHCADEHSKIFNKLDK